MTTTQEKITIRTLDEITRRVRATFGTEAG
jgi:hypothetical protein